MFIYFELMTAIEATNTNTATEAAAAPVINTLAGFVPEPVSNGATKASALFLSLDAARAVGTPLYTLDSEGSRQYLPPSFIGRLLELHAIEKDYQGDYEPQTKLLTRLAIGDSTFVLHVGLNSWAGQSLLTSLCQLTPEQLAMPLKFRMIAGRRTCFARVSTGSDNDGWTPVEVASDFLSSRMETGELLTLAQSIDELL